MKSINFKRGSSVLRVLEEQGRKKPKFNWDRLIYFFILLIVGFFLLRYAYYKLFYVEASGQILFERVNIMNADDCRILSYQVDEGDLVKRGDSLFIFKTDLDGNVGGSTPLILPDIAEERKPEWIEREKFNINKALLNHKVTLEESKSLLSSVEQRIQLLKNEVLLDISTRAKLTEANDKKLQLEAEIKRLQNEIDLANVFLASLQSTELEIIQEQKRIRNQSAPGLGTGQSVFFSPLEGTVTKINYQPYEVALKSEVILSIHKPENIFIKAFFEQKDLSQLSEGDLVELEFPDGSYSKGRIKRFYFATNTLPEEFQKKFEPTTRSLTADIFPENPEDLFKWRAFYKMSVRVLKPKFSI